MRAEVGKLVAGQEHVVDQLIVALLCDGHVLVEGVPGTAKTLMSRALAKTVGVDYNRIQFTPDLMPSDVVGTNVFDPSKNSFELRKGPVFTGMLLADEINRTPPKTQAALLEAMQEKSVTIDGKSNPLAPVFMVIATQNPIEFEGTYPLPEAQLDRFMFKIIVDYPDHETEVQVCRLFSEGVLSTRQDVDLADTVIDESEVIALRKTVSGLVCEDKIIDYIARLVRATRDNPNTVLGASPRASIYLLQASKATAALAGRDFVIPDDVKQVAKSVLRHRLILKPEAEIEGYRSDNIVDNCLEDIDVPK